MRPPRTLIKGGSIIDGTGGAEYVADIALAEGRIVEIGRELGSAQAEETLSAQGLAVCPGFVDSHSHDDLYLLIDPACSVKVLQGITTTVAGNCGMSAAPLVEESFEEVMDILRCFGGETAARMHLGVQSFKDYTLKLKSAGLGINVALLVGHTTVRMAVMGTQQRPPNSRELAAMCDLSVLAMKEGAFGLSSGLIYAPGSYAEPDEIAALNRKIARYGGIYTTHVRNEGDLLTSALEEAIDTGRETGIHVHISHHKVMGEKNRGKSRETLGIMEDARRENVRVTCDQYPYDAASTTLSAVLPHSALDQGAVGVQERLRDPEKRNALRAEIESGRIGGGENLVKLAGFERIFISAADARPDCIGRSIADAARRSSMDPYDLMFDLVCEEARGTTVVVFAMNDVDIERIMRDPFTMIGTDGIPMFGENKTHPRLTGTFPRVLGTYVREKGILSLEEAIRKMTSLPCRTFGIPAKGLLKEGYDADLVIFDPGRVKDHSTYDSPYLRPEGIHTVLVAGEVAVKNGEVLGIRSGKVLRPDHQ